MELELEKAQLELSRRPEQKQYDELAARAVALAQLVDGVMESEGWGAPGAAAAVATQQGTQALLQVRGSVGRGRRRLWLSRRG